MAYSQDTHSGETVKEQQPREPFARILNITKKSPLMRMIRWLIKRLKRAGICVQDVAILSASRKTERHYSNSCKLHPRNIENSIAEQKKPKAADQDVTWSAPIAS